MGQIAPHDDEKNDHSVDLDLVRLKYDDPNMILNDE
jgi:hypothetical protein